MPMLETWRRILGWVVPLALACSVDVCGLAEEWSPETAAPKARVVSLAPNLTELVYALGLGDRLIGRSSACDYPPEARMLPVAGDFGRPNMEWLQRMKPDLVLMTDLENPALRKAIEAAGIRDLELSCESWKKLMDAALAIGRELQVPEAGEKWVEAMEKRRATLAGETEAFWSGRPRPLVYVEIWCDPITAAGPDSFLNDLVELAGGRNMGGDLKAPYVHVSVEWVIRENPDVILTAYMLQDASSRKRLQERVGWKNIKAVQSGSVCDSIPADLLLRSGPRMLDGAVSFAGWLREWEGKRRVMK
ncbi:MAG: helical backbone metal receptor [Lentisphaerota bacterium]